jgi:hypothetical protein
MNATLHTTKIIRSAHNLFPPDQALLWLPGLAGDETPYCTYNEHRADLRYDNRRSDWMPEQDQNGATYIPPYPVSNETHIAWHTNVCPPYPYHPVPLVRTLSALELSELGRNVTELLGEKPDAHADPVKVLRNDHKPYVLAALARMGLLPGSSLTLRPYS